jgi:DNA repair protein RadC
LNPDGCAAPWCSGLGQSRPTQTGVRHVAVFHFFRCRVDALLVRDVDGQYRPARAEEVLSQARRVLSQRVRRGATMSSPQAVKDYLRLEIGVLEHEVFCVLFLDAQHRIIELKQMFRGTVTQTSVYPREVVKAALAVQFGRCRPGAQPPLRFGRAEPGRRVPDADAEDGAGAGGRAGARSPGGGGRRGLRFLGARPAVGRARGT